MAGGLRRCGAASMHFAASLHVGSLAESDTGATLIFPALSGAGWAEQQSPLPCRGRQLTADAQPICVVMNEVCSLRVRWPQLQLKSSQPTKRWPIRSPYLELARLCTATDVQPGQPSGSDGHYRVSKTAWWTLFRPRMMLVKPILLVTAAGCCCYSSFVRSPLYRCRRQHPTPPRECIGCARAGQSSAEKSAK